MRQLRMMMIIKIRDCNKVTDGASSLQWVNISWKKENMCGTLCTRAINHHGMTCHWRLLDSTYIIVHHHILCQTCPPFTIETCVLVLLAYHVQEHTHSLTTRTLALRMMWAFTRAASSSRWSGLDNQRCRSAVRELRAMSVGHNMVNGWWLSIANTGNNPAS